MEKLGKKLKHDHTLTSILKFAIFSLVMLAPVFSVASRCLYVICNKNAKDSYSNLNSFVYKYETNDVNATQDLIEGNIYTFYLQEGFIDACRIGLSSIIIEEDLDYYNFKNISLEYDTTIRTHYNFNGVTYDTFVIIPYNDVTNVYTTVNKINFIYGNSNFNTNLYNLLPCISKCENIPVEDVSNISGYLDNAFEYSLSQLEESSYYNWATNLGIYTPIYNMVHGLGAHDIVALLLSYWAIYTCIYVVFDIIIVCFVKITHFMQSE